MIKNENIGILEVGGGSRCTAKIPLRKVSPHAHIGTGNELVTHLGVYVPSPICS